MQLPKGFLRAEGRGHIAKDKGIRAYIGRRAVGRVHGAMDKDQRVKDGGQKLKDRGHIAEGGGQMAKGKELRT